MKKTNFLKLAGLIIAISLMISGIIGINAGAEDGVLEVKAANVAYNDMMQLAFALDNTDALPAGAEAGIIIWKNAKSSNTVANSDYTSFEACTDDSVTYYKSYGIAAPLINTMFYVSACYRLDGNITVTQSAPVGYSIATYVESRLTENITKNQADLYYNILFYGAASDAILDTDDQLPLIKTVGGYVGDYNSIYCIADDENDRYLIRAKAVNDDGEYFIKWINDAGETVSEDRIAYVSGGTGITTYTAVFGDLEDSNYAYAEGFDTYAAGEIPFASPDLSVAPTGANCYGSYSKKGMSYLVYAEDGTATTKTVATFSGYRKYYSDIDNVSIATIFIPATTSYDETTKLYTLAQDEEGNFSIAAKDSYFLVDNGYGDNKLYLDKGQHAAGVNISVTNPNKVARALEFDFCYEEFASRDVEYYYYFTLTDGTTSVNYRLNIQNDSSKQLTVYGEAPDGGARAYITEGGETKFSEYSKGEKLTIGTKLRMEERTVDETTTEVGVLDIYFNGELFGSIDLSAICDHSTSLVLDAAYLKSATVGCVSSTYNDISVDNFCFIK